MKFIVETLSELSDEEGPIDPINGFPTHHPDFIIEADSQEEAEKIANEKWPNDIMAVFSDDLNT